MIIKEKCEDFLVNEIPLDDFYQKEAAQHQVYLLKKTNYTTERALTHIAKALHIQRKFVSFAGTKDKKAITTQYITISGAKKDRVMSLTLKDIELKFIGYRKERLSLGKLKGNNFSILVKGVSIKHNIPKQFYVPNYFDEQRFSTHNVILGTYILKKQYKEAIDIFLEVDDDYKELMMTHLEKQTNDYIGALRLIPRKNFLFYVHAVQSYLFNQKLIEEIKKTQTTFELKYSEGVFLFPKTILSKVEQKEGELIGFESEEGYLNIEPMDFINKSLPELALTGGKRPFYSIVKDCKLTEEKSGVRLEFILFKGSYATIVLKQLFGQTII